MLLLRSQQPPLHLGPPSQATPAGFRSWTVALSLPSACFLDAHTTRVVSFCLPISVHGVNSVAGQEDRDEYNYPGLMKADDKDLESDEALWALYHRWCKYFKIERSLEEMTHRFGEFKETVLSLREARNSKNSSRIQINSLADRSMAEFASRRPLVSYEAYLAAKAMQGCIITCESDED